MKKSLPKIQVVFHVQREINPNFRTVWTSKKPYNVLKGGRNSFKSSVIALKLVKDMVNMIHKGEHANVVIVRKVGNTLRTSVFNKIKWALDKFGISYQFRSTVAPFQIIHRETGSTFYFYGQDDFEKLKSNELGNIISVWYEEAAEFESAEEFDQSNSTFMRQKHDDVPFVQFFWSYNPPRNPYSWINEWAEAMRHEDDYLVHQSSYQDDRLGFVTEQMLKDIERIKRNDYDYYRYLYLGEAVGLGTNVYNFELFQKIKKLPDDEYIMSLSYGLDTGHQQSATALTCVGYTNKGNVVVLDTYYYSPKNKSRKLAPDELSKAIHNFLQETSKRYGLPIYKRTIDSAEGAIRNQYYKDYGVRWNPIAKKKKVIMIDYVVTLLAQGRVFYLDNKNNEVFEQQHKNYRWDEKTIESDKPKVIEEDDHVPDAFMYFVNDNLRELKLVF